MFVLSAVAAAKTSFLNLDSGPPSLKSKSKHVTASTSTPTAPEVSTCTVTPSVQTSPSPSTPLTTAPAPDLPEPDRVETASKDVDVPQPEDSKSQELKKDTEEPEVSHVYLLIESVRLLLTLYFNE